MTFRFLALVCFALLWSAIGHTAEDLKARIEKIIKAQSIPRSQLGLAVIDLNEPSHPLVFGLNEEADLIPASVTKIATAITVLRHLGPTYKFETSLWSSANIDNGVLKGNLFLKGGGDSGFVSETLWFLVNEFVRTGVHKIDGDLVVDDSAFDAVRTDPSRDNGRVDRAYDAPVGAMSFNWNSINVFVRPSLVGQAPTVYLDPISDGFQIHNSAKTDSRAVTEINIGRKGDKVSVSGSIGIHQPEFVAYKNIEDPVEWSGRNLKNFLSQRGIEVTGKVKSGTTPESARKLARSESKPISMHITDMLKFSNNFVAEMLTKDLAAHDGIKPATLSSGMSIINSTVEELGIEKKRFNLINPSGLSRKNHMKPVDIARLVAAAQKDFPIFAEFLVGLPIAGLDGTLKNRMLNTPASGWARAKTGHLQGIASLAGIAGRKDGSSSAFAFVYNAKDEQNALARRLFDAIVVELVQ